MSCGEASNLILHVLLRHLGSLALSSASPPWYLEKAFIHVPGLAGKRRAAVATEMHPGTRFVRVRPHGQISIFDGEQEHVVDLSSVRSSGQAAAILEVLSEHFPPLGE